ncbi:MAG TPA: 4Fe-4S dicluster domain-containing protein [Thermodesulfobacteriota bacterium]|nr:4Fe-4S dicluster domain-containing protein [Thermodesulfobacteriota bacterium]
MKKSIQALSLLLFSGFFLLATYKLSDWFPADIYLRLDPLLGLNAVLAAKEVVGRVLWSLILIGATLVIGRFFCAYVCPMGACIDSLDFLFFRKIRRPFLRADASLRRVKYFLLVIFISAALAGLSIVYLMDPIALLTRFYTFVVYPLVITLMNLLLDLFRPLFQGLGWITLSHLHYPQPVYYMSAITLLIFGGLIALNRLAPRFWCRYLCPLGALLSLISPLGIFKRRVSQDCNECLICQKTCSMGAIAENNLKSHSAECIQCKNCAKVCPQEAISFPASFSVGGEYSAVSLSRREFFFSLAGGLTLGFLGSQSPFTPLQSKHQIIRPPGALPETEFLRTCIRCGECMKSCLTNTLQPSVWESGFSGLWTPNLDLRMAPCDPNCNVCGRVCPTQAIRSLSMDEKTHAKIGTAILRKEMCLVWAQNKLCLICDEICPYNAIVFRPVEGYRRPVVIASRCNGCGFCEQRCPVKGESAIIVVPDGEIRLKEGSYIKEAKKLQLEFKPDPGDDKYILQDSGFEIESEKKKEKTVPATETPKPEKPKGFL